MSGVGRRLVPRLMRRRRLFNPNPDSFPTGKPAVVAPRLSVPGNVPGFADPAPEDTTQRTGLYEYLDSNVGAAAMEFTYASIPKINSALSVRRFGFANPTRPYQVSWTPPLLPSTGRIDLV